MATRIALLALVCLGVVTAQFPNPSETKKVPKTIPVKKGTPYDGKGARHTAGFADGGQDEGQPPVFELEDGAIIRNVVLGAPAADGIHCLGSCTIENVCGGGAKKADDKVFQHNGGGTLTIKNFYVENVGKLYRSCGNCENNSKSLPRKVVIDGVTAKGPIKSLADCLVSLPQYAVDGRLAFHIMTFITNSSQQSPFLDGGGDTVWRYLCLRRLVPGTTECVMDTSG
ncbi:pectate lyase [Aphelenchoides avenae]|nr:pectate lyase [Aphelenchus avenae]